MFGRQRRLCMPMPDLICFGRKQDSSYYWVDYTSSQLGIKAKMSDSM